MKKAVKLFWKKGIENKKQEAKEEKKKKKGWNYSAKVRLFLGT